VLPHSGDLRVRRSGAWRCALKRSGVVLSLALVVAAVAAATAQAHEATVTFSCTGITYTYTGFPNQPNNTIREFVGIDEHEVAHQEFTFNGPSGAHTISLSVPEGEHEVNTFVEWNTNGVSGKQRFASTLTCRPPAPSPAPGLSVQKLQEIKGSGSGFTTSTLNATVGQTISYETIVTNTGNVDLALSFNDPHCDPNTVMGPLGALNANGTLAPGASAIYVCSHVLMAGDAPQLTNVATVTGQPPSGPPVSGTSSVVTNVAQLAVSPVCVVSTIVLRGGAGSKRRPFTVHISTLGIKEITFLLDGRRVKTAKSSHAKKGVFSLRVDPRKLRYGAHTLSVRAIPIDPACPSTAKTALFVRPRPRMIKPKFTG